MARIITIEIDQTTGGITVYLEGREDKGCAAVQEAFARTLRSDVQITGTEGRRHPEDEEKMTVNWS
jgi:hypothetical protein